MKYIVNTSNDPAYNIALEAYAFRELVDEDELFILWIKVGDSFYFQTYHCW